MTPEAQRIAIAEACGWKILPQEVHPAVTYEWGIRVCYIHEENKELIPDYLSDLNAMHESLRSQSQAFRAEFDFKLHAIAEEKHLLITELTAKDWADCFILVLQSQRDGGNSTP